MNPQLRTLLVTLLSMPELFSDEQARAFAIENKLPSDDNLAIAEIRKRFTAQPQQVAPPVIPPTAPDSELIEAGKRALIVQEADQIFAFCPDLKHLQEECRTAILAGTMDMKAVRTKILAERAKVPTPGRNILVSHDGEEQTRSRITNAFLMRSGLTASKLTEQQKQAAHEFRYMSITNAMRHLLGARGVAGVHSMSNSEIIEASMRHSSGDFPAIIAAVARTSMVMGFDSIASTWKEYCGIHPVSDFESHTLLQFGGSGALQIVGQNAEFQQKSFYEKSETVKLRKYGEDFSLSWEMMLADKMDKFLEIPFHQANRWSRTLNELPIKLLLANAALRDTVALFHADHHNLLTGSEEAPDTVAKATVAIKAHRLTMRNQKAMDYGQNPDPSVAANIQLTHIICGSTYEENFFNALFEGGRADNNSDAFIRNSGVKLISDPLVELGTGGSTVHSFGIGAGNTNPGIKIALLDGKAEPMLSQKEGDRDNLIFRIKGAAAAGVADHRALSKCAGV